MIKTYASIADLANDAENGIRQDARNRASMDWFNNETLEDTLSFCRHGNPHLVPAAEKLIDLFDAEAGIEMPRKTWQNRPAGMFPDVPAYLMGQPCTMKILVEEPNEHAPISLLVISSSSAGISAETLQKRGACILALTLLLSRRRPLSLQTVFISDGKDNGETILSTRIETAPLDLAVACYALSSSGFDRRINHFLARKHNGFTGGWPPAYRYYEASHATYFQHLIDELSPNPERTLLIPPSQLNDELLTQPVTWLKTQVARFIEEREENA